MELSICCDAAVKLENMRNVNEVQCVVNELKSRADALEGNIRIFGAISRRWRMFMTSWNSFLYNRL